MVTKTYTVNGMTCSGCVRTVETLLKNTEGVQSVQVTLEPGEAQIAFDENVTSPEAISAKLNVMGYDMITS